MGINSIHTTYGAAFIGLNISAILYGLTLMQTYFYFRKYPKDSLKLKLLVVVLWLLDTLHLILCIIAIYWYLIINFDNPVNLAFNHWSINLQTDCNGAIGLFVELFFAVRVWKVSKSPILTGIISILASLYFALGVYFTAKIFALKEFSEYDQLTWVTSVGIGSAAATDILIAAALVYYLNRSRTGFKHTDSLIGTLMLYAINTGLLTSICATIAVIAFATMPNNFIWLAFFWCIGKLHVNSLLASLNSRASLRARVRPRDGNVVNLSSLRSDGALGSPGLNVHSSNIIELPQQLQINVQTVKEHMSDFSRSATPINKDRISPITPSSTIPRISTNYNPNYKERIWVDSPS